MCTNGKWIYNKYTDDHIFVDCGHCPSCLQKKAFNRASRIRNTVKPGYVFLFVTLTYKNEYVPYIRRSDFIKSDLRPLFKLNDDGFEVVDSYCKNVCVYRSDFVRRKYARHIPDCYFPHGILSNENVLSSIDLELGSFDISSVCNNINCSDDDDKIAVCYYKDLQDFFKRLRIILKREYNYELPFKFFGCSEYGPATNRPHFHTLIQCPLEKIDIFKSSIVKAWPFCSRSRFARKGIEVARDASSYVSTYVNSTNMSQPFFFQKAIRAKCSYSKNFGLSLPAFSYSQIQEKVLSGNIRYNVLRNVDGVPMVDSFILPKYVINRRFPNFKGRFRLSSSEILDVIVRPEKLYEYNYVYSLGLTIEDIYRVSVRLRNKVVEFRDECFPSLDIDIAAFYYGYLYVRVVSLYYSELLKSNFDDVSSPVQLQECYDNILEFYEGSVFSPSLDDALLSVDIPRVVDPNRFRKRVISTASYTDLFYKYDKYKKFSEKIYNHF